MVEWPLIGAHNMENAVAAIAAARHAGVPVAQAVESLKKFAGVARRMQVRGEVNGSRPANKRLLVAAIKETAAALGNTPAVCRGSYICPLIMTGFEKGEVIDRHFASVKELMSYRGTGLHPAERSLLRFLKQTTRHA